MKAAFYAGMTGLTAHQTAMDSIGNNLANLQTSGYKTEEVSFQSLLYDDMYANTDTNPLTGYGVRAVSQGVNFSQGELKSTSGALDFAIEGSGLFAVQTGGRIGYTRGGDFGISMDGTTPYLTTATGAYVLNRNGQRIQIPYKADSTIDTDAIEAQLGLFTFRNPDALTPGANGVYTANAQSGAAQAAAAGSTIRSGALELSGTSALDEMTDLIRVQRGYQICARVLQTADENEQTVNNLRK